jgi:uncharacterized protein
MKRLIILDAYNYIFYSHAQKSMENEYLSSLRDNLMSEMDEYCKFTGMHMIIIFDGHFSRQGGSSHKKSEAVDVIYSKKGQSADSIIERLSKNVKNHASVFVVTSDYDQQKVIFRDNVYRKSIREFKLELDAFKKDVRSEIAEIKKGAKNISFNLVGKKMGKDLLERFSKSKKAKE